MAKSPGKRRRTPPPPPARRRRRISREQVLSIGVIVLMALAALVRLVGPLLRLR